METIERTAEEQRRIDLQDLNDSLHTAAGLVDRIGALARAADSAATALAFAVAEAERLHRWVGVTLRYKGSWWDNRRRRRVDASSHIFGAREAIRGRGQPDTLVVHLGRGVPQELPSRLPQATRPRHLLFL